MADEDYGVFAAGSPSRVVQVATPSGREISVSFRGVSVGDVMEATSPGDDGVDPSDFVQAVRLLAAAIVSWDLPQPPSPQVIAQMTPAFFGALSAAANRAVGDPLAGRAAAATGNGSAPRPVPSPLAPLSPIAPYPPSSPTSTGAPSAPSRAEEESGISRPA